MKMSEIIEDWKDREDEEVLIELECFHGGIGRFPVKDLIGHVIRIYIDEPNAKTVMSGLQHHSKEELQEFKDVRLNRLNQKTRSDVL